jgi:hypothetical protein
MQTCGQKVQGDDAAEKQVNHPEHPCVRSIGDDAQCRYRAGIVRPVAEKDLDEFDQQKEDEESAQKPPKKAEYGLLRVINTGQKGDEGAAGQIGCEHIQNGQDGTVPVRAAQHVREHGAGHGEEDGRREWR